MFRVTSCALAVLLTPGLALVPSEGAAVARARQTKQAARDHHFHGVVVHVHHNQKDRHHGTITVLGHEHEDHKNGKKREMKFHVNEKTLFEVVEVHGKGKGARRVTHKGGFGKVHDGSHVHVLHHGHHAVEVKVIHHHKK